MLCRFLTIGILNNKRARGWSAFAAMVGTFVTMAIIFVASAITRGASRHEVEKFDASITAALRNALSSLLWRNDVSSAAPSVVAFLAAATVVYKAEGRESVLNWCAEIPINAIEKFHHIFCPVFIEEFLAALHDSTVAIGATLAVLLAPIIAGNMRTFTSRHYTM